MLLYDGECNLCDNAVRFVSRRDRHHAFRYAPLQSEEGRQLLTAQGLDPRYLDSVVVVSGGQAWLKSDAALEVLRLLGRPWSLFYWLRFLPRFLRDAVYSLIARIRYRLFGKKEYCEFQPKI